MRLILLVALLFATSYAQTDSLNVRRDLQGRRHCWKDSYGRGVGRPLNSCPDGQEKQGSLCYKSCKPGYKGRAHLCWQQCKEGERKIGTLCRVSWWRTYIRRSYNRGVGKPMGCGGSRSERQAGLCYTPCRSGFVGNGPVCWSRCVNKFPVNGGALCCQTQADCASKIINMITGVNPKDPINSAKGFIMPKCSEVNSVSDELALGGPVAEIEGEETVGESSLADYSSDYSSDSSSDDEDFDDYSEAFEEFGAYNVLFFDAIDATKGVLALVGLVATSYGLYHMTCGKAKIYKEIDRLETQDGYGANGAC